MHAPSGPRRWTYLTDSITETLVFELSCLPSALALGLGLVVGNEWV